MAKRNKHSKNRKESRCNQCNKWMRKDILERHQGTHEAIKQCPFCKDWFKSGANHINRCRYAPKIHCFLCRKAFPWRTPHQPKRCYERIHENTYRIKFRDELGTYWKDIVTKEDVLYEQGFYASGPLRKFYMGAATHERMALELI